MFALKTLEFQDVLLRVSKYASSKRAKEALLLEEPSNSFAFVSRGLEEVDLARRYYASFLELPLAGFNMDTVLLDRIRLNARLNVNDLNLIQGLIYATNNVINYYRNNILKNKLDGVLSDYFSALKPLNELNKRLNEVLDDDGNIKDTATDELYKIRNKMKNYEAELRRKMQELLLSHAKMLNESLIVMRDGKMCLPVKVEYKNAFKGIIHDESASHVTVYIEPYSALEISNKLTGAKEEEKAEIDRLLGLLSNEVFKNKDDIIKNDEILLKLDLIYAKAKYAYANECYKPQLNQDGLTVLKAARHPLIDKDKCVPIDLLIGSNYDAIIITGPNTGGKTVALKTMGLLTIMAQTGLLIPASSESNINVFDNVFADIGDEQSIACSLSSFSSHMVNVINILNHLSYNSLVLLDELGSGTDPKEGSNLAISIVEEILKYGAKVIVTTHYADLKAFAYEHENIINASVEFDTDTLKPTYKILLGVPGRSNAIIIASKLGLKEEIIKRAKELNEQSHSNVSQMISKLEEKNHELNALITQNEELQKKLLVEQDDLAKEREKITLEYEKYQQKAKKEAAEIIGNTQAEAQKILDKLKTLQNQSYKEHEIADIKHQLNELDSNETVTAPNYDFKVGDLVYVESWKQNGLIKKINKDKYEVSIGNFNIVFNKNELRLAKKQEFINKPKPKQQSTVPSRISSAKLECDLRGLRYEEVAAKLDQFIDKAYLAGLSQVYIIHGFGTGAVRKATYEFLKKCPHIKATRFGGEGEGLNGVTVAYLK